MSQWIWTARRPANGNEQHTTLLDIQEKKESLGNNVLQNENSTNRRNKNVTDKLLKSKHIKRMSRLCPVSFFTIVYATKLFFI